MIKIDELKTQPIIGETYLVPCIISKKYLPNQDWCLDDNDSVVLPTPYSTNIYPIINHKHSDKENGQNYEHYHVDYRFVETIMKEGIVSVVQLHSAHTFAPSLRYDLHHGNRDYDENYKITYHALKCLRLNQYGIASKELLKKSKLKHKCIHKGKCPHRGYDLSQEVPNNGIITCPLHGLEFNAETKQLI